MKKYSPNEKEGLVWWFSMQIRTYMYNLPSLKCYSPEEINGREASGDDKWYLSMT